MLLETCTFMYIKRKMMTRQCVNVSEHCTPNSSESPSKSYTRLTFFNRRLVVKVKNLKTEHRVVQLFTIHVHN